MILFYWSYFFSYPWTASMIWTSGKSKNTNSKLPFKTRPIGHDRGTQQSQWIEQPWIPRQSLSFSLFDTITWHPTTAICAFNVKSILEMWIQLQSLPERPFSATITRVISPQFIHKIDARNDLRNKEWRTWSTFGRNYLIAAELPSLTSTRHVGNLTIWWNSSAPISANSILVA